MAATIPDALRPRLSRFVRLLASDQPGEVVAAAAALKRALAGCGADLNDLGDLVEHPAERAVPVEREAPARPRRGRGARASDMVLDMLRARGIADALERASERSALTTWEEDFAASLLPTLRGRAPRLSARQMEVVERLMRKFGETRA